MNPPSRCPGDGGAWDQPSAGPELLVGGDPLAHGAELGLVLPRVLLVGRQRRPQLPVQRAQVEGSVRLHRPAAAGTGLWAPRGGRELLSRQARLASCGGCASCSSSLAEHLDGNTDPCYYRNRALPGSWPASETPLLSRQPHETMHRQQGGPHFCCYSPAGMHARPPSLPPVVIILPGCAPQHPHSCRDALGGHCTPPPLHPASLTPVSAALLGHAARHPHSYHDIPAGLLTPPPSLLSRQPRRPGRALSRCHSARPRGARPRRGCPGRA